MDVITQISNYLTNNVTLNAAITSPVLKSDARSVAIRETPSSISNRYINGKTLGFRFQILVKDPSVIKARDITNDITRALDGLPQGSITSAYFVLSSCECVALPNWVETTERNEHIYSALFNAELEQGGN
jgi:hypothetical protein